MDVDLKAKTFKCQISAWPCGPLDDLHFNKLMFRILQIYSRAEPQFISLPLCSHLKASLALQPLPSFCLSTPLFLLFLLFLQLHNPIYPCFSNKIFEHITVHTRCIKLYLVQMKIPLVLNDVGACTCEHMFDYTLIFCQYYE